MMMMLVNLCKRKSQAIITKNLSVPTLMKYQCFTTRGRPYDRTRAWLNYLNHKPANFEEFKISLKRRNLGYDYDRSNKRPDSVIDLLHTFGFYDHTISHIVRTDVRVLTDYDPQKEMMPMLNYLLYITQSESAVISIVLQDPRIFFRGFDSFLIPLFNLLKSVMGGYQNAANFLNNNQHVIRESMTDSFLLNIRLLFEIGVPRSLIVKVMKDLGKVGLKPHDDFRYAVLKLKDLGFDLSSTTFLNCIKPMTSLGENAWESRCVLFKSFGFSDHEILAIFKRRPEFMSYNKELIVEKMEFFLYKLQWTPFMLSSLPAVLIYSIEKRIRPRCSVLQVLVSKSTSSEGYMLSKILAMTDEKFLEDFVTAHEDEFPKVIKAYQGKLRFKKYTFKQKEQLNSKPS